MSIQLQLRRGSTSDHAIFAGADGEVTVDLTKQVLVSHDGTTIGGFPMQRELAILSNGASIISQPSSLNFVGCTVNAAGNIVTVTIPTPAEANNAATANALTNARVIALAGDASGSTSFDGSSNVSITTTLATIGTAGTYNSVVTDSKGRVVSGSTTAYLTGNQNITVTGDVSGSGTNAITLSLATINMNVGTFGSSNSVATLTVNGKGLITSVSNTSIAFPVNSVFGRNGAVTLESSDVTDALGFTPLSNTLVGTANGLATLDGSGKLTSSQLPSSVVGALVYQGTWDAFANNPSLSSISGTKGHYYKVSNAGTTTLNGISSWNLDDTVVYDGSAWDKIDGITNEVLSVAGKTGVVTLAVADVSGAAPLASPALTGTPTAPTAATSDNSNTIATTAFIKAQNYLASNQTITVTGDATGTGTNTVALTLATVNASVGTYGSTTSSVILTVNAKGLITAASSSAIAFPVTSVFGRTGAVALSGADVTGALGYTPVAPTYIFTTATGDANNGGTYGTYNPGNGILSVPVILNSSGVTAGTYGTATQVATLAINAKGIVTGALNTNITFPVTSVFGRTGSVTLASSDVTTALGFTPQGAIAATGDVSGTATQNAITLTLASVGTAGTYNSVVTDAKGRVVSGSIVANQTITVTGDASGSGTNAITLTLANVNTSVGTFGSNATLAAITVNAKGLITAVSNVAIAFPVTSVAGRTGAVTLSVADVANALSNVTLVGSVTGTSNTAGVITTVLANSGVTAGSYTAFGSLNINSQGLVTSVTPVTGTGYDAGGWSTTNYYSFTGAGMNVGTGNFTFEMWFFPTGSTSGQTLFYAPSGVSVVYGNFTLTLTVNTLTITLPSASVWTHVAFVRQSGTIKGYINGVLAGSASDTTNCTGTNYVIGSDGTYPLQATSLISNLRFNNTAVYTGNFAVPSGLLTNIAGTQLLIIQGATIADNSSNNYSITTHGTVTISSVAGVQFYVPTSTTSLTATVTLSGDATGSGSFSGNNTTTIATVLANSGVTAGTYTQVVVNAKGLVTSASNASSSGISSTGGTFTGSVVVSNANLTISGGTLITGNILANAISTTFIMNGTGSVFSGYNGSFSNNLFVSGNATISGNLAGSVGSFTSSIFTNNNLFVAGSGTFGSITAGAITGTGVTAYGTTTGTLMAFANAAQSSRWLMRYTTAESGSNAGSDLNIQAIADNGSTLINTPIIITRSTGVVKFAVPPTITTAIAAGDNSSNVATTAYVQSSLGTLANPMFNSLGIAYGTVASNNGPGFVIENAATNTRWSFLAIGTEAGANTGADLFIKAYPDSGSGAQAQTAIKITRATALVTLANMVSTTGSYTSTLGVAGVTTLAGFTATTGTFTGLVALNGQTTAVTATTADNSTNVATTAWVKNQGYSAGGLSTVTLTGAVTGTSNASGAITTVLANSGVVAGNYTDVQVSNSGVVTLGGTTYGTGYSAGGWSSSNYVAVTGSGFNVGTGSATLEFWFFPTNAAPNGQLFWYGNTNNCFAITYSLGQVLNWGPVSNIISYTLPTQNKWYHIAFVRTSNVVTLYVNGVNVQSAADTTNYTTTTYYLGYCAPLGLYPANAATLISNFRVTNTAVYTQNFVPPSQALLPIPGTIFQTAQSPTFVDIGPNAYTVTVTGSPTMTAISNVAFGSFLYPSGINAVYANTAFTANSIAVGSSISATTGTYSSTLGVGGVATLSGGFTTTSGTFSTSLKSASGTFTSTLGVAGVSTLAGFTATTGTFSGLVAFNGQTTAVTVANTDNTTNVATTAWVKNQGYSTSGGSGSSASPALVVSGDATGTEAISSFTSSFQTGGVGLTQNLYTIAYGNGVYAATWLSSNACATSTDGINWTPNGGIPSGFNNTQLMLYGNGLFFLANSGGNVTATSSNGVTWTTQTLPSSTSWSSGAYGNGTYMLVSKTTAVATSTNGSTWTAQTGQTGSWVSTAYGNNTFVSVAGANTTTAAQYSTNNGVTWTLATTPQIGAWKSIAYGNNIFVAVSAASTAMYSTNGITWTGVTTLPVESGGYTVSFGGGVFFATTTGTPANGLASVDGINWYTLTFANDVYQTVYGANQFVTISGTQSQYGTITPVANSSGALTLTLASTGVSAGTYGSNVAIPTVTVDSKGRVTSISTNIMYGITQSYYGSYASGAYSSFTLPATLSASSGGYCVEFFLQLTTAVTTSYQTPVVGATGNVGGGLTIALYNDGTANVIAGAKFGYANFAAGYKTLNPGTWYHVAFIGTASNTYLFVNGSLVGTASSPTFSAPLSVGAPNNTQNSTPAMYVSNFRVVTGSTVYSTSGFTAPVYGTNVLTAISGTQVLILNTPTIADASTNALSITNTGSVTVATSATQIINAVSVNTAFATGTFTPNTVAASVITTGYITPTISSGTLTIDLSAGELYSVSLSASITSVPTTNNPVSGVVRKWYVVFTGTGTAATVTWGSAYKWAGGTSPTVTTTSGKRDLYQFITYDGGTSILSSIVGQNY